MVRQRFSTTLKHSSWLSRIWKTAPTCVRPAQWRRIRLEMRSTETNFRWFWWAHSVSVLGSQLGSGAFTLTAILVLHAGALEVSLLAAISSGSGLLTGPVIGPLVDRLPRRPLLIFADWTRAVLLLLVPVAAWFGLLGLPLLMLVAALVSILNAVFEIASPAYLPSLVAEDGLVRANSRLMASSSVSEVIGQPLGGLLVQSIGATQTMLIDGVSFMFSAIGLSRIRLTQAPIPIRERVSLLVEALEGFRFVFAHRVLGWITLAMLGSSFGGGILGSLYTLYGLHELSLTPFLIGLTVGLGGLSSLLGALIVERLTSSFGLRRTLVAGAILGALIQLLIPLARAPLALVFLVLAQTGDVFGTVSRVSESSLQQQLTPSDWLGRVHASQHFLSSLALTFGALAGGWIAERYGLRIAILLGVIGLIVSSLATLPLLAAQKTVVTAGP